jgi:hypothetical protein
MWRDEVRSVWHPACRAGHLKQHSDMQKVLWRALRVLRVSVVSLFRVLVHHRETENPEKKLKPGHYRICSICPSGAHPLTLGTDRRSLLSEN